MNISGFEIKAYGKGELAQLYNPQMGVRSSLRTLSVWIKRNGVLHDKLQETGLVPCCKIYTPRQVKLIVEYLGEP